MTVVDVPLGSLTAESKLSDDQRAKTGTLEKAVRPPRPEGGPPAGIGVPPHNEGAPLLRPEFANPTRGQEPAHRDSEIAHQIQGMLAPGQRSALPAVIKKAISFHDTGIPLEIYGELNLSAGQKRQILSQPLLLRTTDRAHEEAARHARHEKLKTLLTSRQRNALEAFRKSHALPAPLDRREADGFGRNADNAGGFSGPTPEGAVDQRTRQGAANYCLPTVLRVKRAAVPSKPHLEQ